MEKYRHRILPLSVTGQPPSNREETAARAILTVSALRALCTYFVGGIYPPARHSRVRALRGRLWKLVVTQLA